MVSITESETRFGYLWGFPMAAAPSVPRVTLSSFVYEMYNASPSVVVMAPVTTKDGAPQVDFKT